MAFTGMMVLVTFVTGAVGASGLEVQTVASVSLVSGKEATLTCGYNRSVFAAYWRYKPPSSQLELLVALDKYYQVGERSGPGYDKRRFNITDDYSLIIEDVQADDDGTYICEVSDFITGRAVRNHTDVSVIVTAEHPFIRISQCGNDASSDEKSEPCSLHINRDQHTELTCSVIRVKPKVELTWTSPELGGRVMNASMKPEGRGDGAFDQTSTIVIDTSQRFDKRSFICTGEGMAVDGIANRTITIYFAKYKAGSIVVTILGPLCVAVIVATAVVIGLRRRKRDYGTITYLASQKAETDIDAKRIYIRNYPSHEAANDEESQTITLGFFGLAKSGKSSLINNIFLALHGFYPTETYGGAATAEGDDDEVLLTNQIKMMNYKGNVDDNPNSMRDLSDQIVEKWGPSAENHERTKIDCPIFVFRHNRRDIDQIKDFIKSLCQNVHSFFGREPMVVITNEGKLGECFPMEAELVRTTGIPKDHIFIFENYRLDKGVIMTRKLLDFVFRCLKVGEKTNFFY